MTVAPFLAGAATFDRQLEVGMSGSDVSALQAFLATDATLYPQGLVTGYFGFLTKAAVSNFQNRNGLPAVGRVGPMTLPVLNLQVSGGVNTGVDVSAALITNVAVTTHNTSATVAWTTSEFARGVVHYSNNPLILTERLNAIDVSGGNVASTDSAFRAPQNVTLQGLQGNTIYYYLIHTTDQAGNVSVTWPTTFRTSQ